MELRWTSKQKHRLNPGEVLREAIQDAAAGRHSLALRKHLWFHKNSIKIQRSLSGVRRSDTLRAWKNLADQYPPARAALIRTRNAAERAVWKDRDPWPAFHDFSSINEYLETENQTLFLFLELHRKSPKRASRVYSLAEPLLAAASEFSICNHYLEPPAQFDRYKRNYRVNLRLAKDPEIGPDYQQFAENWFAEKVTRLIALLVLNGRLSEAKRISRRARRVLSDHGFNKRLDNAERGKFSG